MHGSAEFKIWHSEVTRWLKNASPYAQDQQRAFQNLGFRQLNIWDRPHREELWEDLMVRAEYLLTVALENISREWVTPETAAKMGTDADYMPVRSGIVINNVNSQVNEITVQAVLEQIAKQLQNKDPEAAKTFRERMQKWAENPIFKTLLESGLGAISKHYEA